MRTSTSNLSTPFRFSGFLRDKTAEQQRGRLEAWLKARGMEHEDDWRVAGYNPPWTIPQLRRNEVLVSGRPRLQRLRLPRSGPQKRRGLRLPRSA